MLSPKRSCKNAPSLALKYCSCTWLIISATPAAVCQADKENVYVGSKIEKTGYSTELPVPSFSWVAGLLMTILPFISDPIANTVKTAATGKAC